MAKPPSVLYWVDFRLNGAERINLPYGQRRHHTASKGGKFTRLEEAERRVADLRREWPDAHIEILSTGELEWHRVMERNDEKA